MTNTLYSFVDVDRSRKVRWLLAELGLPFAEKRLDWDKGDHRSAEFRDVSPFGLVPGVVVNGVKMFESSAICAYLADQYPAKGLAPRIDSPERAAYTSWLFFGATTLENEVMDVIRWRKSPDDASRYTMALESLKSVLDPLEAWVSKNTYLCGADFSAADIVAGYPLAVASESGHLGGFVEIGKYVGRLMERPAAQASKTFTAKFPEKKA